LASVSWPVWAGFVGVSVVAAAISQWTLPVFIDGDDYSGFYALLYVSAMAALVVGLRISGRTILVSGIGAGVAFAIIAWGRMAAGSSVLAAVIPGVLMMVGVMFASRLSAWMLDIVVELDRAQQTSAR